MRHPLFRAWWIEARCRMRPRAGLVATAILAATALLLYLGLRFGSLLLDASSSHPVIANVLVAVESSALSQLERRRWEDAYSTNWLSTLPVSRRLRTGMIAARVCFYPLLILMLLSLVALLIRAPVTLFAGIAMATVAGIVLGWFIPQRTVDDSLTRDCASGSPPWVLLPSLASLSSWSVTQARVWLRPRSIARVLLPAMLALPMGTSGNTAIAVLTLLMLTVYLCVLLIAMFQVAREGEAWLRPTPITLYRLVIAVAARPLLQQVQWTLVAAVLFVALGATPVGAARLAEWWLALVTVTSGILLAPTRRGNSAPLRLIFSFCTLILANRLKHHLILPCALLISAWHLKEAQRT